MRFAFISTMLGAPWGGSEELWSQAAIQFQRSGHEVCALVPYRQQLSEKLLALASNGIAVRSYPSPAFITGWVPYAWKRVTFGSRRCYRWLRRFSPDLAIISQGEIADGLEWARVCRESGIPYVQLVHCNSESFWFKPSAVNDAVTSYTGARKVFCVSRSNLELLRLQVGEPLRNAEIVWNPCNVAFQSAPAWPTQSEQWKIACVARLDPAAKGQDLLLQTLSHPKWRDRPVEVSFFGEGPHDLTLRRIQEMMQLKSVQFRGHVKDVRAIWEEHHILALPSRYEGLPLVLVEAMWCGRPAIVTDVAGNAELCVDGRTGFVAQSPTIASFAEAMERAWYARNQWKAMGAAALERIETIAPRDPVDLFCERLKACAAGSAEQVVVPSDSTAAAERILQ